MPSAAVRRLGNQKYPADIDRKDPVPVFDVNLLELP